MKVCPFLSRTFEYETAHGTQGGDLCDCIGSDCKMWANPPIDNCLLSMAAAVIIAKEMPK